MTGAASAASSVTGALALLVIVVGLARAVLSRAPTAVVLAGAFTLALELFLAGGLLRLAALNTFSAIGLTAAIIVVRRLISTGLRYAERAAGA